MGSFLFSAYYRNAPLHPLFWFPVFISIYGCWYYLFLFTSGIEITDSDIIFLQCSCIALLSFSVPCLFLKTSHLNIYFSKSDVFRFDKFVGSIFCILLIVYMISILDGDFNSKRAVKDSLNGWWSLVSTAALVGFNIMAIRAIVDRRYSNYANSLSLSVFLIIALAAFMILGERELLLSIALLLFLLIFPSMTKGNLLFFFYFFVFLGVFGVAFSQEMKAMLLGGVDWKKIGSQNLFRSDFYAPGRNFSYLDPHFANDMNGWDVLKTELERVYLSFMPGSSPMSMSSWFNNVYRERLGIESKSGWGFTIIGSAYLAGGYIAVAFHFLVLGCFVSFIIRIGRFFSMIFISYVCIIPIMIYSLRQDFSYLINYYIKFGIMFNFILLIIYVIVKYSLYSLHRRSR